MHDHRAYQQTPAILCAIFLLTGCLGKPASEEVESINVPEPEPSIASSTAVSPFMVIPEQTPQTATNDYASTAKPVDQSHDYTYVNGTISAYVSQNDFEVAGTPVDASQISRADNGDHLSELANGRCIEARGHLVYQHHRTVLRAARIKFKNSDCY